MSEWRNGELSEIAKITMGQSPSGDSTNNDVVGLPLLNGPTEFGAHNPIPAQYTTDAKKLAEIGDLLFCVRGSTTGRMNWADQIYAIGRGIAAFQHKNGYQPFLRAVIEYKLPELLISATGSTFPNVSKSQLHELPILIPPIEEQREIANILGSLDDKIEANRRENETLEAMARAIFKSWFVDFDPVHAKANGEAPYGMDADTAGLFPDDFEDSELGMIPRGWESKTVSDFCQVRRGSSPRPIKDYVGGTIPWVKIADATASVGPFVFETKEHIKQEGVKNSIFLEAGTLILSNSATLGIPVFLELNGCIHDGWLWFQDLHTISQIYLYHILLDLADYLNQIADGTVQKNLNTTLVSNQNLVLPSKPVLIAYESIAKSIFDKMRENTRESRTLAETRDALLPRLISGELRVGEV